MVGKGKIAHCLVCVLATAVLPLHSVFLTLAFEQQVPEEYKSPGRESIKG